MSDPIPGQFPGNGQPPEAAPGAAQGQQLIINAQYIKDLSFENPRAPQSLMQQAAPPSVEINIDVKAQGVGPENYEVVLTINPVGPERSTSRALSSPLLSFSTVS